MEFPFIGTTAVENYSLQVSESNLQKIINKWDKCKTLEILDRIINFYQFCNDIGKTNIWNYNGTFSN